jgi:hypothetical protein
MNHTPSATPKKEFWKLSLTEFKAGKVRESLGLLPLWLKGASP